ncbi:MBL fold metallo-hydrolase [Xylanimonas protaetiae]|uniref:MBL fold metallo-hydrolase n=1 Tax=Xylanimonas protaetiae TaxID=2509457 RepID=A0A4P6F065_9MICO|nr:MBL fold metallo-hydrolase [Xylanimonas protaetiae]QAY68842.1 MBL fold metallo-hydrolase [Xylanimonas protaetiae]
MQLAPNLHRVGNDLVAAYVVADDSGVTLVDAGLAGQLRDLRRELAAMGRTLADVRGVVLTHGDTDHIGFAERLRREHGVPVFVGEADAARARGEESTKPAWGRVRVGAVARFLWYAARKGGLRTTYLTEVTPVHDGDVLDLPGAPRIVALPGHSPGSVAVHVPAVDAVFVGDALTTRHVLTGEPGPQPAPFTDDPDAARASHARLATVDAAWVLPGHGTPWHRGTREIADVLARFSG